MLFRLLGPVEAQAHGRMVTVGRPQQRLVLSVLLVESGRLVPVETLIDRVWETAPDGARRTLQVHITRLRRLLAQAGCTTGTSTRLIRRSGGYLLDIDPGRVDVHRFRRLLALARDAQCSDTNRVAGLREAIGLWRGEPLSGLPGQWAARVRAAWQQEHLDAVALWAQSEHRLGNPAAVIGELTELLGEHPLAEPLAGELMRALHAVGRTADALDLYARIRHLLADALGIDPGHHLQQSYQAILRGETDSRCTAHLSAPPGPMPAQLRAEVRGFTGRTEHLGRLDALLSTDDQPTSIAIAAVSGTAGVGKTALAVHWAHQVKDRFPDGQLYVNLGGFGPDAAVLDPAEALLRFLDALNVPAQRIPADLEARAALYRSVLARRRTLVVLDNARDSGQVRPLLPGTPGCLVLVTSRNQLSSLVSTDGAVPVALDLLSVDEARQLLAARLSRRRVAAEPQAVEEIINACSRLPLALAIVAARAATHPHFSLAALAAELADGRDRLDALTGDDPGTDLRAVLSWSYYALTAPAAKLFRLLCLHPGPDVTVPTAASLTELGTAQMRPLLTELTRTNLLTEHRPGRYTFHGLLRAYAADLSDSASKVRGHSGYGRAHNH